MPGTPVSNQVQSQDLSKAGALYAQQTASRAEFMVHVCVGENLDFCPWTMVTFLFYYNPERQAEQIILSPP